MRRDDPTFRMRREQLGELVSLTSQMPALRRTAEMPVVDLHDLLRKDRDLDTAPIPAAEPLQPDLRCESTTRRYPLQSPELAVGTSQILLPSNLRLVLGCIAAFIGGFALTIPLWW